MKHFSLVLMAILLVACSAEESTTNIATDTQPTQTSAPAPAPAPAPASPTPATDGVKTVDIKISGGEYSPASISVAKGQPVRLNFTRDEKPTCGDVLVFPALNIRKEIPVNQVVSVDLNPQQAGEIKFTCGMNMMKGTVVVQ